MTTKAYTVLGWVTWQVATRMTTKAYKVLGWVALQVATRIVKRRMADNKVKLGAAATVLLVLAGGVLAARAAGED